MNTQVDSNTQIQQHIDAARARWAKQQQVEAERQQAEASRLAGIAEKMHQQLLQHLAAWLPGWMLEYVQPSYDSDYDTAIDFISVRLPGCSPINLRFDAARRVVVGYGTEEPLRIACDDDWWVKVNHVRCSDLDEAIHLAALWGESYHTMQTEADRRNAEGLRPADFTVKPAPEPDTVGQAGDLLARYAAGASIAPKYSDRDDTVLLGSLLYAIAHQLRRLANATEAHNA
jgi:hypothetical protein